MNTRTDNMIAEYRKAYAAANGQPAPAVTFRAGWFKVGTMQAVRYAELQQMAKRLWDRSRADPPVPLPKPLNVVIDVTKATLAEYPGFHVMRHADTNEVVALCPMRDDMLEDGQWSWAPALQRIINK